MRKAIQDTKQPNRNYGAGNGTKKLENLLSGLKNRMEMTEDKISESEKNAIKFTQSELQKENNKNRLPRTLENTKAT
jgi:hypothetical protein